MLINREHIAPTELGLSIMQETINIRLLRSLILLRRTHVD
jgi:hypothetical protein